MSSPLASTVNAAGKPQVVKKKREGHVEKDSGDEAEEWLQEFFDRRGGKSAQETSAGPESAKSPSARDLGTSAANTKRTHRKNYSKLLGCYIQAERGKKKPKLLVLCDLFGMFLKRDGIGKEERQEMINVVVQLLRKDKLVSSYAPIRESVRHRVAEERRYFRFSADNTDSILAQAKKNAAELHFVDTVLEVSKDFMKGIDERDRRRRKREQLREAAAKMGMTLEELEAARAKSSKPEKSGKKGASPLRNGKASSPLSSPQGRALPAVPASLSSPPQHAATPGSPRHFVRPKKSSIEQDKHFRDVVNLDLLRKANIKVLAALGFPDTKGEKDFSNNTAEEDLDLRSKLADHMNSVAEVLHERTVCDADFKVRLKERKLKETTYSYLLDYLDTLNEFDKDGKLTSIASLKDIYKMERKQADQLAINRIRLRFDMERPIASNDAFLGKNELMRASALLRTVMYVKAWMLLYKHAETSKQMRAIGERIGFNSTGSLKRKVLTSLRDQCALRQEMRVKLKNATAFFSKSVTMRDECFRLWRQAVRLSKQVTASRFKAQANSWHQLVFSVFEAWQRIVQNKKRAFSRWANGTLLWAFGAWAGFVHAAHDFEAELEGKLGRTLMAAGKVLKGLIFREWCELARKKKKALRRWTHSALVHMFQLWAGMCAERWQLYAEVQDKCKGVAARLKGAYRDLCFHAWSASVLKDRRARARFVNSTLYMCLSSWKGLAREEKRQRQVLDNIRMRIERRAEIMVLQAYRDVVAERVHMRKVLKQILSMWLDKGRRAGFRSLWLYATRRKRHRELLAEGLLRVVRSRSKRALIGFRINRDQEVRVRVVLARIRWRPAAVALEVWNKVVMDVIYAQQRALAAKSPIIARFLKRAMVEAFAAWHTLAAEAARHLRIIKRMRMRVIYAAAIAALQQWAVYMEDMAQERHQELVSCAQTALTNGDMRPLEQTLARHFKVPHVRRKYKVQSMREVVAEVLANGGASHGALVLLGAQSLEYHDDEKQVPSGAAYATAGPRDEGTSLALFKELEGRKHLRSAFARTMRRSCEVTEHGGVQWEDPPPRPAALKRDAMGDLQAARHAAEHRHDGLQMCYKAQRLDTGTAQAHSVRSRESGAEETKSHLDATQWVLGVLPSNKIVNKMGVGRMHADSYYASSLPVPVTDLNCTSVEVKIGARHRIQDLHHPLPPRVIKGDATKHDPDSALAKTLPSDVAEWYAARQAHGDGPRTGAARSARTALGAADLVGTKQDRYTADASKYRDRGGEHMVQDRLGHFRSVLGIPDLRASGPKKARNHSKSALAGKLGIGWRSLSRGANEDTRLAGEGATFERVGTSVTQGDWSLGEEPEEGAVALPMLNTALRATGGLHRQHAQRTGTTGARGSMEAAFGARPGAQTALGLVSPSSALHAGAFEKSQRLLARLGSQS